MTTPGGVPNLPLGALTLENIAESLQNMTSEAMKSRAAGRFPSIFDGSTGADPALDLTPFGILTWIWANINSAIANADPADIDGPEDLPGLFIDFIEGLPVIGQLIGLLEAILGTYSGDDEVLLAVQAIFDPIRRLLQMVAGIIGDGFPTLAEVEAGWAGVVGALGDFLSGDWQSLLDNLVDGLSGNTIGTTVGAEIGDVFDSLDDFFGDTGTFAATGAQIQALIDAIWQAITGLGNVDNLIDDVFNALQNIPGLNILGVGGPADIWSTLQSTWDQLISGFVNVIDTGASLADLFNVGNIIGSGSFLGTASWDKLGIRNAEPATGGMLSSSTTTVPLHTATSGTSANTVGVTNSTAITGWQRIDKDKAIGAVRWHGYGLTNITAFQVALKRIRPGNPQGSTHIDLLYVSGNIVGDLDPGGSISLPPIQACDFTSTPVELQAGDWLGTELIPVGSGTHSVAKTEVWSAPDPHVVPRRLASLRDAAVVMSGSLIDIYEDFDTVDTDKWTYFGGATVSGGQLSLPTGSARIDSVDHFNLSGGGGPQLIVQVPQVAAGAQTTELALVDPSGDSFRLYQNNGNLFFDEVISGSHDQTFITYNSSTHLWWRLRYDSGTLYWDSSSDAISWVNRRSKAKHASLDMSDVIVRLATGGTNAKFDHVNIIPGENLTTTTSIPLIEAAVDLGVGLPYHAPQIVQFNTAGSFTQPIPSWCGHIQVVTLGAGGGGWLSSGSTGEGEGGDAGSWGTGQWDRGTHFDETVTTVSVTVGTHGAGGIRGGSFAFPTAGTSSSASIPGHTVTGTGGAGGNTLGAYPSTLHVGKTPGNQVFGTVTYVGGLEQNTYGAPGSPAGGGGAGLRGTTSGTAGAGAPGSVWLRFLQ